MAAKCEVCNEASSKYKCPCCRIPYCSVPCYKQHKETPCSATAAPSNGQGDYTESSQGQREWEPSNGEEEGHRLSKQQLESLAASDTVRNMLRDEDLQKVIFHIDGSPDMEKVLDIATRNPAFKEFSDKVLATLQQGE